MSRGVDDETVLALHRSGLSIKDTAARLGYSQRAIGRARRRLGIARPVVDLPPLGERLEAAKRFLEDGAPYCEVTRTVHVATRTLAKYLPGYGWDHARASEFYSGCRKIARDIPGGADLWGYSHR